VQQILLRLRQEVRLYAIAELNERLERSWQVLAEMRHGVQQLHQQIRQRRDEEAWQTYQAKYFSNALRSAAIVDRIAHELRNEVVAFRAHLVAKAVATRRTIVEHALALEQVLDDVKAVGGLQMKLLELTHRVVDSARALADLFEDTNWLRQLKSDLYGRGKWKGDMSSSFSKTFFMGALNRDSQKMETTRALLGLFWLHEALCDFHRTIGIYAHLYRHINSVRRQTAYLPEILAFTRSYASLYLAAGEFHSQAASIRIHSKCLADYGRETYRGDAASRRARYISADKVADKMLIRAQAIADIVKDHLYRGIALPTVNVPSEFRQAQIRTFGPMMNTISNFRDIRARVKYVADVLEHQSFGYISPAKGEAFVQSVNRYFANDAVHQRELWKATTLAMCWHGASMMYHGRDTSKRAAKDKSTLARSLDMGLSKREVSLAPLPSPPPVVLATHPWLHDTSMYPKGNGIAVDYIISLPTLRIVAKEMLQSEVIALDIIGVKHKRQQRATVESRNVEFLLLANGKQIAIIHAGVFAQAQMGAADTLRDLLGDKNIIKVGVGMAKKVRILEHEELLDVENWIDLPSVQGRPNKDKRFSVGKSTLLSTMVASALGRSLPELDNEKQMLSCGVNDPTKYFHGEYFPDWVEI